MSYKQIKNALSYHYPKGMQKNTTDTKIAELVAAINEQLFKQNEIDLARLLLDPLLELEFDLALIVDIQLALQQEAFKSETQSLARDEITAIVNSAQCICFLC